MNLLVVDNNLQNCQLLEAVLTENGYHVTTAHNGREALHLLDDEHFHGIVSNVFMPVMDGIQLCRTVKQDTRLKKIPFIFLGDALDEGDEPVLLSLGADLICRQSQKDMVQRIKDCIKAPGVERPLLAEAAYLEAYCSVLKNQLNRTVENTENIEKELSQSKTKYQKLFERANDAIFILDREGGHIEANEKASRLLGYTEDEFKMLSFREIVVPSAIPDSEDKLVQLLTGEEVPVYEKEFRTKDGKIIPVEISASAVRDESGEIAYIQSIVRDITQRKEAEEEIAYRLTIEEAIAAASKQFVSQSTDFYEVAKGLGEAVSADRVYISEIRNNRMKTRYEWCSPGTGPQEKARQNRDTAAFPWWMQMLEQGEIVIPDVDALPPEAAAEKESFQSHGICSLLVVPIRSPAGELTGFVGFDDTKTCRQWTAEDIQALRMVTEMIATYQERKRVGEALKESENRFRALVQNSSDVIYVLDGEGFIQYVSPNVQQVLGYREPAPSESLRVLDFIHPDDTHTAKKALDELKEHPERDMKCEFRVRSIDGSYLWMRVWGKNLLDDPAVIGIVLNIRNITDSKKAEEKLRESEILYRNIVELAPDGIMTMNMKGVITSCNTAFAKMTGLLKENLVGMQFAKLPTVRARDIPKYFSILNDIIMGKVPKPFQFTWLYKGETLKLGEVHIAVMKKEGRITGFQAIARDITDRQKAEEMLRLSEEKYKNVIENLNYGVYRVTPGDKGEFIDVNQAFVRILGYKSKEEVLKLKVSDLYCNPEDRKVYSTKMMEQGILRNEELHMKKKDGTPIIVNDTGKIVDVDGNLCFDGVIEDITSRKRTDEELENYRHHLEEIVGERTSELKLANQKLEQEVADRMLAEESLAAEKERLSVTLRSIGDGVITTDMEGVVTSINKVAERLTGWTQEEAVGNALRTVFQIINERTREPCENPVDKVLAQGTIVGLGNDTVLIAKDGTERVIADSGAPIRDKNSRIIGVVLVFRDITEKLKMEQELLRTQKLESIGILAGGIAHDFNNILTAILSNVTLAKMYVTDNRIKAKLSKIEKASLQATDLTQQLLTFSKGGAPIKKTTSIAGLIKDSASFALRGSNVRCHFYIPDGLWSVDVDEGQISQVVNNLIINANQAMPEGGIIQVRAENVTVTAEDGIPLEPGEYIKVSIKDQGVGIPKKYLHMIFDPYFTTKQKGTGLGLATSYSIIKKHTGYIDAESEVGIGTTIHFWLPVSGVVGEKRENLHEEILGGQGKVLLMDDEEIIREAAGEVLQYLGYTVGFAEDGKEAVELYTEAQKEDPFDVVIMDLTIPGGMGGKETIQELLKVDPDVKAIVSSGYSTNPVMADFKSYGFKGVVTKPYSIEELSETLHRILNNE
jgi:PAS domain S-box-containing protein